jgi:hypothetical protein
MTVINNHHKFIFVHIPKSAGTTVTQVLSQYTTWRDLELGGTGFGENIARPYSRRFGLGKHARLARLQSILGAECASYVTFAFVRNPYDRAYSIYKFLKRWRAWPNSDVMDDFSTFEQFAVSDLFQASPGPDNMFRPQAFWISAADGFPNISFVGRVEQVEEDLKRILGTCGISADIKDLNRVNASSQKDEWKFQYNGPQADAVRHRFARDFDMFGYSEHC